MFLKIRVAWVCLKGRGKRKPKGKPKEGSWRDTRKNSVLLGCREPQCLNNPIKSHRPYRARRPKLATLTNGSQGLWRPAELLWAHVLCMFLGGLSRNWECLPVKSTRGTLDWQRSGPVQGEPKGGAAHLLPPPTSSIRIVG